MHEHELHVSRALAGAKLHALKKLCVLLDSLDPVKQFAEIRRVASVILRAKGDDIEPDFGCAVPPTNKPPKPPHTDPTYHDDNLEDLPPQPHARGSRTPPPAPPRERTDVQETQEVSAAARPPAVSSQSLLHAPATNDHALGVKQATGP